METKLSNEDKSKIFALYLGSDYQVEYVSVTTGNKTVRRGNLSIFDLYMYQPEKWEDIYTVKLLLKDLSEITLDHALEIIKIDFQRGELPEDIEHIELRRERPAIIYRWRGQNSQLTLSLTTKTA